MVIGRRGEGTPPYAFHGVRCKAGRVVREADPYGGLQGVRWAGDRKGRPYGGVQGVRYGGVKFSDLLGCCMGEGNGGGNGEGGEGIGENYKEV